MLNCFLPLPISFNICFGCLKEPLHWDRSFEFPQHMYWLRNKKIIFWYTLLTKSLIYTNLFLKRVILWKLRSSQKWKCTWLQQIRPHQWHINGFKVPQHCLSWETFFKYWPVWFEHCGYMWHICLLIASSNHVIARFFYSNLLSICVITRHWNHFYDQKIF